MPVKNLISYLLDRDWTEPNERFLCWPPDAFAVAASVLKASGAYVNITRGWPPQGFEIGEMPNAENDNPYHEKMTQLGKEWRLSWSRDGYTIPKYVLDLWSKVWKHRDKALKDVGKEDELWPALVQIVAVADQASGGLGVKMGPGIFMEAISLTVESLADASKDFVATPTTLCKEIKSNKVVVLPKMSTPQTGMTIRSLSHHIALVSNTEAVPIWYQALSDRSQQFSEAMNLLLLPWPLKIHPSQFCPVEKGVIETTNIPQAVFGLFQYKPRELDPIQVANVEKICDQVKDQIGPVHGIVLPEMALNNKGFARLVDVAKQKDVELLIGGIYEKTTSDPGENAVRIWRRMVTLVDGTETVHEHKVLQQKHHRWMLDRSQICRYGLGATLNPRLKWWEYSRMIGRSLALVNLDGWLTLAALVCEDLSRPDPVAEVIRAVGPNLVIALLQDGPQLNSRWPARYATVLADDPGSSVLTLTSLGMTELSRPPGKAVSRVIALWKQTGEDAIEIDMPPGADALVLCLSKEKEKQWTADGRHDSGETGLVKLAGIHPIFLGK